MFRFPRAVWLLGWVSLATDAATEAIYPLLPFFLTRVLGAGAVTLGVLEGAAEAVNSLLKIVSGRLADRSRRKRPLVLLGYGVSSIARPFIALTTTWAQVFVVRVLDRVGKGVRGAPRDAILATWTTPTTRGKIYGFHRAMDHAGAVIGPALASLFLWFYPEHYRTLSRFVPLMWAGLHVVKAAVSVVGGSWSDRVGRRTVIAIGWLTYAVVYAGFATSTTLPALLEWFFLYGFYFGFAEGTEKALVADLTPGDRRGFGFGVYNALQGLGGLAASIVFGLVWKSYGAPAAFGLGATLAVAATVLLFLAVPKTQAV